MEQLRPSILPEDRASVDDSGPCRRCELSGHGSRFIWGEGNPAAPLFVVLDNPGAREDQAGDPFLCGTRETMQRAAYEAGLGPDSFYVSYLLKCRPRKAYDKEKARAACIPFLWGQLETAGPDLVMSLGNVVCRSLFGDPGAAVKELRGRVHRVRGYRVVTSYHPLAVRRRPVLFKYFLSDWQLAAGLLNRAGSGSAPPLRRRDKD